MATELAVAYVSLVIESSKVPGQVEKTLKGLDVPATNAGRSMGSRLADGIGMTFRTAAATIGLAAGAVFGTAIQKGFSRMVAIDDARGKLEGLGHSAEGVAEILKNANAAVTGTAFGMGEAATAAASAVAAGIAQGEDLTNYLKLVGDTATIAGSNMSEMGYIFNKIQSSGKAYTSDLNMLADRGIPIFQWLQKEYGKSAEELGKMVSDGKVDAVTFRKVIQENIGGAALASGDTLRGGWKNMQAALGRIGEAAMSPFLPMMKSSLGAIRRWADQIKPHVARAATYLATSLSEMGAAFQSHGLSVTGAASNWEKFGIKARQVVDGIRGTFSLIKDGQYLGKDMTFGFDENSRFVDWILRTREAIGKLVDSVKSKDMSGVKDFFNSLRGNDVNGNGYTEIKGIGETLTESMKKLGDASKTVGKSMASILGDAGVVGSVVLEHFARVLALVADNTWLVSAGLMGYVAAMTAAKVVHVGFEALTAFRNLLSPATIAAQTALSRALTQHNAAIRAYLASIGQEVAVTPGAIATRIASARAWANSTFQASLATSTLQRWSTAAVAAAGSTNLLNAALFRTVGAVTAAGARIQAVTATAFGGLRNAASGAASLLGGPWGVALTAAAVGIMGYYSHTEQAKRIQDALSSSVIEGAKAQDSLTKALSATNGEFDRSSLKESGKLISANMAEISKVADEGHSSWESFWNSATTANDRIREIATLGAGGGDPLSRWFTQDDYNRTQRAIDQMGTLRKALAEQRLDMDDLPRVVSSGGEAYENLVISLRRAGDAGSDVLDSIQRSREQIAGIAEAVQRSTPGLGTLTDAVATLADTTADADDRVSGLKQALDALSGKPVDLQDAMQSYNDSIRDVIDSTERQWDKGKGFGLELIDPGSGGINTLTENGSKLRTVLKDLRDETAEVAAAGGDLGPVFERNTEVIRKLGESVGLTEPQIVQLAESIGYMPDQITALVNIKGAGQARQQLEVIRSLLDANRGGVRIDTKLLGSDEVIRQLQRAGGAVQEVTGQPGVFEVHAPDVQSVIDQVQKLIDMNLPDKVQRVRIDQFQGLSAQGSFDPGNNHYGRGGSFDLPHNATGGTIQGPGTGTSDSILGIDKATGIPTSWVSRGEEVTNAKSSSKWRWLLKMINRDDSRLKNLPAFAEGGTVPFGIESAIEAAQKVEGNKYKWGGTGPLNFDCSGFVGWLHQIVMGIVGSTKRLYTTYSLIGGATAGLEPGLGPSGTYFRVGTSDDHMAATIAGLAVESGGAHGTSGIGGGRAKAEDSQFPHKFHLPNALIAGFGSLLRGGKMIEWTDEDERELTRLHLQVQRAKERRDEVYADEKSTPNDRQLADLDVQDAEAAVIKKQTQKDKQGQIEGGSREAPEAPALSKEYTKEEAERIDKQQAVESAREKRNEVYDDPESSELDKQKADADYSLAIQEAEKPEKKETDSYTTVRDIFSKAAGNAVGAVFDAAKSQLPDKLSSSHWWDVADKGVEIATKDDDQDGTPDIQKALADVAANPQGVMEQLGYTLNQVGQIPAWALFAPKPKVFDTGGWLKPGETAINLSSRPEPIFNSPEQLRQFQGGSLHTADSGIGRDEFERAMLARPNVTVNTDRVSEGIRAFRAESNRASRSYKRR